MLHVQYIILIISGSVGSKLTYGLLNWDRYAISMLGASINILCVMWNLVVEIKIWGCGRVRIKKKRVGGLVSPGGMVKIN